MMHALKHPSFFRPSSRPTSPSPLPSPQPDPSVPSDRPSRPHNKLSLTTFRRPSPAPSPGTHTMPVPLVQDGSYLEMLGLKLSEAVSKALAQPTGPASVNEQLNGKRPIPAGRGRAIGTLISSELKATKDNQHLYRAIIRYLHRPLSVLLSNLSAHLLPLLSSAAFLSPPVPTQQAPNSNPTQLHAIALATFAGELLECFDEMGLGLDVDTRGDGLKIIRDGLTSVVSRVINPLVMGIRNELMPLIEALENPSSTVTKSLPGSKVTVLPHPSITTLQNIMPIYTRALNRYITTPTSQSYLATLLISVIWRALVALAHRQPPIQTTPPGSPTPSFKKHRSSLSATPPAGRFYIKLPPSRPPSPPGMQVPSSASQDARSFLALIEQLPKPTTDQNATRLALEAVEESFYGFKALIGLLEAVQLNAFAKAGQSQEDIEKDLDVLGADLPTLVALPVLLRANILGSTACTDTGRSVASMLSMGEDEYRRSCLSGFSRADECAHLVGHRVLDVLYADYPADPIDAASPAINVIARWLEAEISEEDD